jgi:ABC-type uncharacterized transport system substrate-binding protein
MVMRRRDFVGLVGGAAAWPLAARAQQGGRMRRVGALVNSEERDTESHARIVEFQDGLRALGWTEGRNLRIDYRWATDAERMRAGAAELVGLSPDVLFANGAAALARLQQATRIIPIVFAGVTDPVATGFVASIPRPGGNITGFATYEHTIARKWLELLKEIAPQVVRVMVIYDPANPVTRGYLHEIEAAAPLFGVQISATVVRNAAEIEHAFDAFAGVPNGGLIPMTSLTINAHREQIIALAAKHRLPAVYISRIHVAAGGLASYGVRSVEEGRQAAIYVDRILKGEKPGDLPVQFATRFELVINLKTAKALGLDPPITLLARTDEVIE